MAAVPKKMVRAAVSTATSTTAVPVGKAWIVTNVVVCNSHATTTTTFGLYIDALPVTANVSIAPGEVFTLDCSQVAETSIGIVAGAASVLNAHISGVEMDAV